MSSLMFFYTLAILVACIITSVLSVAAYASSRRKLFLYGCGVFACYAVEMVEIFYYEYTLQNVAFPASDYYVISMPVLRTAIATLSQGFIWAIMLDILDKHSRKLFIWPLVVFVAASAASLAFLPVGPFQQWTYYTMRSVFLIFVGAFFFYTYLTSKDEEFRARIAKLRKFLLIGAALVACVIAEDSYNILVVPMSLAPDWLTLYLSERNYSENVFACYFAVLLIVYAYHVLSIRMREAPVKKDVNDLERHIDEQMPFYQKEHGLSKRECEVMRLLVLGKNNQEIADELFLAVGTIKTHVHNILVKTGQKSREALVLSFWQS